MTCKKILYIKFINNIIIKTEKSEELQYDSYSSFITNLFILNKFINKYGIQVSLTKSLLPSFIFLSTVFLLAYLFFRFLFISFNSQEILERSQYSDY